MAVIQTREKCVYFLQNAFGCSVGLGHVYISSFSTESLVETCVSWHYISGLFQGNLVPRVHWLSGQMPSHPISECICYVSIEDI